MKKRVISAIVMLLIVIPVSIIGGTIFKITALILGLLSLKEMIDIRQTKKEFPFIIKFLAYILITALILNNNGSMIFEYLLDYKIIALLLFPLLSFQTLSTGASSPSKYTNKSCLS